MNKHLKNVHQLAYKDYMLQNMQNKEQTSKINPPVSLKIQASKAPAIFVKQEENLVKIQCKVCGKNFKKNIQLRIHMKNHHA